MSNSFNQTELRQSAIILSKAFILNTPKIDKSDIVSISFASACIEVSPGRRFELLLEATAVYSPAHKLGWSMCFSGWDAQDNSCEALFETQLPYLLSQKLARSASPLADAVVAKPVLLARAFALLPGLASALSGIVARAEALEIAKHVSPVKRATRTKPL